MTLLKLLRARQAWSPAKYELIAAHIEADFKCGHCVHKGYLTKIFKKMGIKRMFKKIKVKDISKLEMNCFWYSWNRRKALFEMAAKLGCGKIALGHHKDDTRETTLLNLFFQGQISTINPSQPLFGGGITVIRPLCYVEENSIRKFAAREGFIRALGKKSKSMDSNRKYLKKFIRDLEKKCPNIKANIFKSINRVKQEYIDLKLG